MECWLEMSQLRHCKVEPNFLANVGTGNECIDQIQDERWLLSQQSLDVSKSDQTKVYSVCDFILSTHKNSGPHIPVFRNKSNKYFVHGKNKCQYINPFRTGVTHQVSSIYDMGKIF